MRRQAAASPSSWPLCSAPAGEPARPQFRDLVAHQRDQRRHHHAKARTGQGRILIDQALAPARRARPRTDPPPPARRRPPRPDAAGNLKTEVSTQNSPSWLEIDRPVRHRAFLRGRLSARRVRKSRPPRRDEIVSGAATPYFVLPRGPPGGVKLGCLPQSGLLSRGQEGNSNETRLRSFGRGRARLRVFLGLRRRRRSPPPGEKIQ